MRKKDNKKLCGCGVACFSCSARVQCEAVHVERYTDKTQHCFVKQVGQMWPDEDECLAYTCVATTPHGELEIVETNYSCPAVKVPACSPCYKVESYTHECCQAMRCVPDDVCCSKGVPSQVC